MKQFAVLQDTNWDMIFGINDDISAEVCIMSRYQQAILANVWKGIAVPLHQNGSQPNKYSVLSKWWEIAHVCSQEEYFADCHMQA